MIQAQLKKLKKQSKKSTESCLDTGKEKTVSSFYVYPYIIFIKDNPLSSKLIIWAYDSEEAKSRAWLILAKSEKFIALSDIEAQKYDNQPYPSAYYFDMYLVVDKLTDILSVLNELSVLGCKKSL